MQPTPTAHRLVMAHDHLDRIGRDLRAEVAALRGRDADGMLLAVVRRYMSDVARLVSREPGGRALRRLPSGDSVSHEIVNDTLNDARIALMAFCHAHREFDNDDPLWLSFSKKTEASDKDEWGDEN